MKNPLNKSPDPKDVAKNITSLLPSKSSEYIGEKEEAVETYGACWPVGSIIEMYEEQVRILENNGASGHVEALDGEFLSNRFYWIYQGDKAQLISVPDENK